MKSNTHISNKAVMDQDTLFSTLAITDTESFPFVFGDNIDGYYEGTTRSYQEGGQYFHKKVAYLGSFISTVDGEVNDRAEAVNATLYPYGIEHNYNNSATDTLSLLSGERTVVLKVQSGEQAILSLLPLFCSIKCVKSVEETDTGFLVTLKKDDKAEEDPQFIAVTTNKPVKLKTLDTPTRKKIAAVTGSQSLSPDFELISIQEQSELIACLSFAHTKEQAVAMGKKSAAEDKLTLHKQKLHEFLLTGHLWTDDMEYNRALMWSRLASQTFVSHEYGTGIWAGLPWFKDCWGRDTFIALPGTSLINGQFTDAKAIITNFASMQMTDESSINYGRIPNRVTSKTNFIYNTTDGTPWMMREIKEYLNYSGDTAFAEEVYPALKRYVESVENNYLDESGLMTHRDPDTWMDAKIEGKIPWSARGNRANDIQALWYTSLLTAIELAKLNNDHKSASHWSALLNRAKQSFTALFWDEDKSVLADHILKDDIPAQEIRPNQLMTLTIPEDGALLPYEIGAKVVNNAVSGLLFPWGICSLDQHNVNFHPYHDNHPNYHKDAAYHNGTVWGWNAGFTVSALVKYGKQDFAYQLSKNLSNQILNQGHRGTMSENLDAYQKNPEQLVETGTYAQAWSVSEFARNAQQDYLGFKPDLLHNRLALTPSLPECWKEMTAHVPFGNGSALSVHFQKVESEMVFNLHCEMEQMLQLEFSIRDSQGTLWLTQLPLQQKMELAFNVDTAELKVNGQPSQPMIKKLERQPLLDDLAFAQPDFSLTHQAEIQNNYLRNKIEGNALEVALDSES